jgi:hypothetical protein
MANGFVDIQNYERMLSDVLSAEIGGDDFCSSLQTFLQQLIAAGRLTSSHLKKLFL